MKGILLDENMNLQVKGGTLVLGETTNQNQKLIIMVNQGEVKSAPTRGVGVLNYLDDEEPQQLLAKIRSELKTEGMTVKTLKLDNNKNFIIDAKYESN